MSLIARMIEAGTPPDIIEEVAMLIAEQRALEKRRANDRQRQQEKRDRDAGHVTSRDVTGCHSEPALSLPPNEKISTPPTHTHPDNITTRAKADPFPCPDGVDETDWAALKSNRKAKKAALTEGAHRQIVRKLGDWARDGWPPGPIVAAAAERGWTTVFETDEMKAASNGKSLHGGRSGRHGSGGPDRRNGFERACDRLIERTEAGRSPDGGIGSAGQRALAPPGTV